MTKSERILANGANAAVSELIRLATDSPELLTPSLALDWKDAVCFDASVSLRLDLAD